MSFRKRTEATFCLSQSSFEPAPAFPLTFANGSVASDSFEDHREVKHNGGERPSCLRYQKVRRPVLQKANSSIEYGVQLAGYGWVVSAWVEMHMLSERGADGTGSGSETLARVYDSQSEIGIGVLLVAGVHGLVERGSRRLSRALLRGMDRGTGVLALIHGDFRLLVGSRSISDASIRVKGGVRCGAHYVFSSQVCSAVAVALGVLSHSGLSLLRFFFGCKGEGVVEVAAVVLEVVFVHTGVIAVVEVAAVVLEVVFVHTGVIAVVEGAEVVLEVVLVFVHTGVIAVVEVAAVVLVFVHTGVIAVVEVAAVVLEVVFVHTGVIAVVEVAAAVCVVGDRVAPLQSPLKRTFLSPRGSDLVSQPCVTKERRRYF
ncbi:unnamed protein product [Arctogadus glacialis]